MLPFPILQWVSPSRTEGLQGLWWLLRWKRTLSVDSSRTFRKQTHHRLFQKPAPASFSMPPLPQQSSIPCDVLPALTCAHRGPLGAFDGGRNRKRCQQQGQCIGWPRNWKTGGCKAVNRLGCATTHVDYRRNHGGEILSLTGRADQGYIKESPQRPECTANKLVHCENE